MEARGQTSKEYFKVLSILHTALLSAQLLFAAVVFYLVSTGQITASSAELGNVFQYVVPAVIVMAVFVSSILFKTQLKSAKTKTELKEKLNDYRGALLIKYALLETPAMFAIVCYLLTAQFLFLGFACLVIVVFLFNRPSPENTANDLELNQQDRLQILDPNAVVAEIKQRPDSDD